MPESVTVLVAETATADPIISAMEARATIFLT